MTAQAAVTPNYIEAARLDRVAFWSPLPGSSELPSEARRLVHDSDSDIKHERLESALDASLSLNALAPDYAPGFIRTAELYVATRRSESARRLLHAIVHRERVLERSDYDQALTKLQAHVNPDIDVIVSLAQRLLEDPAAQQMVPYVPAAIDRLLQTSRPDDSIQLASHWVAREPASPLALSYLVRSCLSNGDGKAALKTIRRFRDEFEADRVWPENLAVSALISIVAPDLDPKWMAVGPVCQGLRSSALNYDHVSSLLEFLVPVLEAPQRALLYAGLLAINADDHQEAQALLQTTPAATPVESYLRSVGLERVAAFSGDNRGRQEALREIWEYFSDQQVASIAENGGIFDPPATRPNVGLEIARNLKETGSYQESMTFLDELIHSGNHSPEIVRLRAEVMGQAGSRNDALTALDALAKQQESTHKYAEAVETLESMVKLAPGSIQIRARIVDCCLKIGRFDQAIEQLVMQGRLFHKAERLREAEAPIHRAIEIATMTSDWDKVNRLHRLLISFAPEETRLRHAAVANYVQYGRSSDAITQLKEIVRIARKQNNLDEAIAASHQMLALDPNDPATYHQLGELLVAIQEYNQADRVYRRLATIAPDDPAVKAKRSAIAALTRARKAST